MIMKYILFFAAVILCSCSSPKPQKPEYFPVDEPATNGVVIIKISF